MVMKSWDLSVAASIGSAEIQDYFAQSETDTVQLYCVHVEYSTVMKSGV